MPERAFYCWRLLATGICFVVFGVGGVVFRFLGFPVLNLVVRDKQQRVQIARNWIRLSFRMFVGIMHGLGVLRYDFEGLDRLERNGLLILANHPSLIDTVFLMALVRHADCILKADLQTNFFTRGPAVAADYIFNDQGVELVEDCIQSLQAGSNLIVFPEGTRTPADDAIRMKRGAAHIALRAKRNITPVIIVCQPRTLEKGGKWWLIPRQQVNFKIIVQEDIEIARFIENSDGDSLSSRNLTGYLQRYFTEELQRHGQCPDRA